MLPTITLRMPWQGRLILLLWAGGLCVLAFALFLPSTLAGKLLLGGICAGVLLWLCWYSGRYFVVVSGRQNAHGGAQLQIKRGRLWQRVYAIPSHAIYSYGSYTTPLLRWGGCCLFVCHAARHTLLLPPLATQDLAPLLRYLGDCA